MSEISPRESKEDWCGLRDAVRSSPSVFWEVFARNRNTESPQTAGALLGFITYCRREGLLPGEAATRVLIDLLQTWNIWEMDQTATGLLATLTYSIYEDDLSNIEAYKPLADFIHQAVIEHRDTFQGPAYDLDIETVHLCASLASRGKLGDVMKASSGELASIVTRLNALLTRLQTNDQVLHDSYGDEIRYVIAELIKSSQPASETE